MIIVDTNVWADYFNGQGSPYVERLQAALIAEEDLTVIPIIVTEVLQGFRTERGFRRARKVLIDLPALDPPIDSHVRAAQLYRTLRRNGITVRGAIDCVIAQFCIDIDATLLSPDADFERIAEYTELVLWRPDD